MMMRHARGDDSRGKPSKGDDGTKTKKHNSVSIAAAFDDLEQPVTLPIRRNEERKRDNGERAHTKRTYFFFFDTAG